MKNLLFIALFCSMGYITTSAQVKNVAYSTPFDEPEHGWRKVIQLSNGNTFLFCYQGKHGIEVYVFNQAHKLISRKEVEGSKWDPKAFKQSKVAGLYELGGAPVIFIQQVLKKTPTLFRFVFNPETGKLVSEDQISELQKYHPGMAFALAYGGVELPAFHVEKSPVSDNYAVTNFNSISPESDNRIEVMYYGVENGKHKVINVANYDAQGYKYVNYVASYVDDKAIYLCAYGYNTKRSGGEDSRLIISRLDKGSSTFTHKKIEFSDDFEDTRGIMTFNPGSGMLQLLTLTYLNKKNNMWSGKQTTTYLPLMSYIDPQSLQIIKAGILKHEYASTRVKDNFKEKTPFSGMPQYMVVNKDNSTSVILEEMFKIQQVSGGQRLTQQTRLGHIGISEFDMSGKEAIGYAAKKAQKAIGDISSFNLHDRVRGKWTYTRPVGLIGNNTDFFSFNYVNTNNGKYLIFNDFPENFDKKGSQKINEVDQASNMHTVYYELKNGFFEKHYLFGAPGGKDQLKFANIASSHFDDHNNTLATLMVERDGRKKQAHIAWIQFQ